MSDITVTVLHILCVECRTALVADSEAKKARLPRRHRCPVCGVEDYYPVRGTPEDLEELGIEYDIEEVEFP